MEDGSGMTVIESRRFGDKAPEAVTTSKPIFSGVVPSTNVSDSNRNVFPKIRDPISETLTLAFTHHWTELIVADPISSTGIPTENPTPTSC